MQLFSNKRRIVLPIIIAVATITVLFASSCNGSKKYGCPNHLIAPPVIVAQF